MAERQWAEAATDFFEAFKNYDEAGNQRRIQCLKYVSGSLSLFCLPSSLFWHFLLGQNRWEEYSWKVITSCTLQKLLDQSTWYFTKSHVDDI